MKSLLILFSVLILTFVMVGCSDDDNPTGADSNNAPTVVSGATTLSPTSVNKIGENTTTISSVFTDIDQSEVDAFKVTFKVREPNNSTEIVLVDTMKNGNGGLTITNGGDGIYTASFNWDPVDAQANGVYDLYFEVTDGIDNVIDSFTNNSDELTISEIYNTATSAWDDAGGYWSTSVDGSSESDFVYFSFTSKDTVSSVVAKPYAIGWDIAFRRTEIKTNGGISTANSGDVEVVSLGVLDYADVTIADTAGAIWVSDFIDNFIDEWYNYNPNTHQLTANQFVYSMKDASSEHMVKFQVDSMVGAGQPPDMGSVWIKYYYNPTVSSSDLSGTLVETEISVGTNVTYFDFSAGQVVSPTNPATSLDWDLKIYAYDIFTNSGPNGSGGCEAFPAFSELDDSTDIDAFTAQPAGAPMFPDIAGSAMTNWYNYTGPPLHQLPSKSEVYLLKTGTSVYKLRVNSYYGDDGSLSSGNFNFIWTEL